MRINGLILQDRNGVKVNGDMPNAVTNSFYVRDFRQQGPVCMNSGGPSWIARRSLFFLTRASRICALPTRSGSESDPAR